MLFAPPPVILALRRSHARVRVLRALARLGRAPAAQLAEAAGLDVRRLGFTLYGELPRYRPELGLVRLGLIREVRLGGQDAYEITALGRRVAREALVRYALR